MNLSKQQQEKLTLAIQAVLGVVIIGLSARSTIRLQTSQTKRQAKKEAREISKLRRSEYRLKNKLMKQRYRSKLQKERRAKPLMHFSRR
ncbi:MAG: hypothetical protein Q4C50_02365 [Eubacteriales bacterium]|nr:hypothetical protein [Eubacteriales bacterium]